jgi:hypothetical protein
MAEERPPKAFPDGEFTAAELKGDHFSWNSMPLLSSACSQNE